MNLTFLNTPIGTDGFVETELNKKLKCLSQKINSIAKMPFKMEASTLPRTCWSQCRVFHIMRTLPPKQIHKFLLGYDQALRKAFENLIDCGLDDKWWAVARMNSKFGGMGLRSGIHTAGAQHLTSLVKNAEGITRFLPSWDIDNIARRTTAEWFSKQLGVMVDMQHFISSL